MRSDRRTRRRIGVKTFSKSPRFQPYARGGGTEEHQSAEMAVLELTPTVVLNDLIVSEHPIASGGVYAKLPAEARMTLPSDTSDEWVTAVDGARLARLPLKTILRLGKANLLTVRRVPKTRPRYIRSELESLARDYIFPRKYPSPAAGQPTHEPHHAAP
jgi:hypothetical protein